MRARVSVYGKPYCWYSAEAARLAGTALLDSDRVPARLAAACSSHPTIPKVFVNDVFLGGMDSLAACMTGGAVPDIVPPGSALDKRGRLKKGHKYVRGMRDAAGTPLITRCEKNC